MPKELSGIVKLVYEALLEIILSSVGKIKCTWPFGDNGAGVGLAFDTWSFIGMKAFFVLLICT